MITTRMDKIYLITKCVYLIQNGTEDGARINEKDLQLLRAVGRFVHAVAIAQKGAEPLWCHLWVRIGT